MRKYDPVYHKSIVENLRELARRYELTVTAEGLDDKTIYDLWNEWSGLSSGDEQDEAFLDELRDKNKEG